MIVAFDKTAPEGTVGWRVAHRTLGQGFKPLR
jgi:hypothetical protein